MGLVRLFVKRAWVLAAAFILFSLAAFSARGQDVESIEWYLMPEGGTVWELCELHAYGFTPIQCWRRSAEVLGVPMRSLNWVPPGMAVPIPVMRGAAPAGGLADEVAARVREELYRAFSDRIDPIDRRIAVIHEDVGDLRDVVREELRKGVAPLGELRDDLRGLASQTGEILSSEERSGVVRESLGPAFGYAYEEAGPKGVRLLSLILVTLLILVAGSLVILFAERNKQRVEHSYKHQADKREHDLEELRLASARAAEQAAAAEEAAKEWRKRHDTVERASMRWRRDADSQTDLLREIRDELASLRKEGRAA